MSRIIYVVFICLLVIFPARAENNYQLREPTPLDYLRIAAEDLGGCNWFPGQSSVTNQPWELCTYLLDKLEAGRGAGLKTAPYDMLSRAYDALQPGKEWTTPGDPQLWGEMLAVAWLREKGIDLEKQREFKIDDMTIQVKPRDFNADGVNEYVLEVEGSYFSTFLVLMRNRDGSYRAIANPLPYHKVNVPYWDYQSNYLREIAFDDFNADGLPEWFLAFDGANYHGQDLGELFLLRWEDGKLQWVNSFPNIPGFKTSANNLSDTSIQDGFVFRNLDDDPALELQRIEIAVDNWSCRQTRITIYDWDTKADSYRTITDGIRRPDTANCVVDEAERALFNQDYSAAAYLYAYAHTLPAQAGYQPKDSTFDVELSQFVQLRLAQAYLLNREYEAANKLLDHLATQPAASPMLDKLRDTLVAHRQSSPADTCTALYNLFEAPVIYAFNYGAFQKVVGTNLYIGLTSKFYGDFIGDGNLANPAVAGCNVPAMIDPFLEKNKFYLSQGSPVDQFQKSGFHVSDSLQADFNGDGRSDWLIWFEAHIPAVLLMDAADHQPLTVLRADIPHPGEYVTPATVPLPDNAGTALVLFEATKGLPSYVGGLNCGNSAKVLGIVQLWQFVENKLTATQSTAWCDDYPTIKELFGTLDGKHVFYVRDQDGKPVPYFWNAETKCYALPAPEAPDEPAVSTPQTQQSPSNEELYQMSDVNDDYYKRLDQQVRDAKRIEAKVAILDAEIHAKYMDYPYVLQYWKATLLQEAGRDDEALAEYIRLYKTTSETVWGKLAAAHLEIVKQAKEPYLETRLGEAFTGYLA